MASENDRDENEETADRGERDEPDAHERDEHADEAGDGTSVPVQLGVQRFVYAAYFAGAILVAFLVSKALRFAWEKLSAYRPLAFGEPKDEIVYVLGALVGAAAAFFYWRRGPLRKLVEEVAEELSKVTWPDKKEVTSSTMVVIVTTIAATLFFAIMDWFWGQLSGVIYGT